MPAPSLRLALFAADAVGAEIARFLGERREPLCALVLDARDTGGHNSAIRGALEGLAETTLASDAIASSDGRAALATARPDLAILAWWPAVVAPEILRIPRIGTLNLHPSYLPYSRGKHYYFWSIVERAPFGVTIHWAEERVDAGPIAFRSRIETSWTDTGGTLYRKAQEGMIKLFRESFDRIKRGDIPREPQDDSVATFHRAAELETASRIDLNKIYKARDLLDLMRARTFPPDGGARFVDDGVEYRVKVEITRVEGPRD